MARITISHLRSVVRGDECSRGLSPEFYFWLAFLSVLDLTLTYFIVWHFAHMGGREVNTVALAVIERFGLPGMVVFKFACVGLAAVICDFIAHHRLPTARRLGAAMMTIASVPVLAAASQLAMVAAGRIH
jgi:hypothetical protein